MLVVHVPKTGIATLLHLKLGWPVGTLVLLFNIPLFILGYRYTGGLTFLLRSGYTVLVMSRAIDLLAPYMPRNISDPLLYTIFGGFLDGLGIGLVFRARGTTGGTDIVAKLVNRFTGLQLGQVILYVNTTVLLAAAAFIGLQPALYALFVTFVIAQVVDTVQEGFGYARSAMIVSSNAEAVRAGLLRELHRGVTVLEGRGGYTESERGVLYCVVAKSEVAALVCLFPCLLYSTILFSDDGLAFGAEHPRDEHAQFTLRLFLRDKEQRAAQGITPVGKCGDRERLALHADRFHRASEVTAGQIADGQSDAADIVEHSLVG